MTNQPTLAGAERGKVQPYRRVRDGVWLLKDDGTLANFPAAMRLLSHRRTSVFRGYARQYLAQKGDGTVDERELNNEVTILSLHWSLIPADSRPGVEVQPLFPFPPTLVSQKGLIDVSSMDALPLRDLADGEVERLVEEYHILRRTQLPPYPTHEQWQAVLEEGKTDALRTLHSRHGSSVLIQVLHGMDGLPWPG